MSLNDIDRLDTSFAEKEIADLINTPPIRDFVRESTWPPCTACTYRSPCDVIQMHSILHIAAYRIFSSTWPIPYNVRLTFLRSLGQNPQNSNRIEKPDLPRIARGSSARKKWYHDLLYSHRAFYEGWSAV